MNRFDMIAALGLLGALGAGPVLAQTASTPSAMSEVHGATTGLGSSHRFATKAAAHQHCPQDTIVWASSNGKTYMTPNAGHGKNGRGFYACKAEADGAGFRPE